MNVKKLHFLVVFSLLTAVGVIFFACGDKTKTRQITVPGKTFAEQLQWLDDNAASNSSYLIKITANEELPPRHLAYFGTNITIHIKGTGKSEMIIALSGNGSLFTVNTDVTLILENITLTGSSDNTRALVQVNSGGSLQLNNGAKITGNNMEGVFNYGGSITMNGGEISGNNNGGALNDIFYTSIDGEYLTIFGTFTINGGKISGNTTVTSGGGGIYNNGIVVMNGGEISGNTGGGVHNNGNFTMNGGKISGNISFSFEGGGVHNGVNYTMRDGVYVALNGDFTMTGGDISGNTAFYGGGVSTHGNFTMTDGNISGNTSFFDGGGIDNHGTLKVNGGKISGNTAFFYGGGVSNSVTYTYTYDGYTSEGTFIMKGGEITGNTSSSGGGVFVGNEAFFDKTGGIITGYIEGDSSSNFVKNDSGDYQKDQGHSVYAYHDDNNYIKRKETTDGPMEFLSYNAKAYPPFWNGSWDN